MVSAFFFTSRSIGTVPNKGTMLDVVRSDQNDSWWVKWEDIMIPPLTHTVYKLTLCCHVFHRLICSVWIIRFLNPSYLSTLQVEDLLQWDKIIHNTKQLHTHIHNAEYTCTHITQYTHHTQYTCTHITHMHTHALNTHNTQAIWRTNTASSQLTSNLISQHLQFKKGPRMDNTGCLVLSTTVKHGRMRVKSWVTWPKDVPGGDWTSRCWKPQVKQHPR